MRLQIGCIGKILVAGQRRSKGCVPAPQTQPHALMPSQDVRLRLRMEVSHKIWQDLLLNARGDTVCDPVTCSNRQ